MGEEFGSCVRCKSLCKVGHLRHRGTKFSVESCDQPFWITGLG